MPATRRAAAAALRHYGKPASAAGRLGAKALCLSLAGGLGGTVVGSTVRVNTAPGADTIETYLRRAISIDLLISIHLGAPRANRKPTLQLLTPVGETIGFAKIGVNTLTRELLRTEHAALIRLERAGLAEITVPQVLHYGAWRGLDVMVLSPIPTWLRRRPAPPARLVPAMAEVARVGEKRREPLAGSAYAKDLASRLALADKGPERTALFEALDTLIKRSDSTVLTYGAWHGDWTHWNMANTRRGLLVWDWERFALGVPLGFDALHNWLQGEVGPRGREPLAAAVDCPDRAAQLVAPFGIPAQDARLTATLYLMELATRYLVDKQAEAGASRGAPGLWLLPAISRELSRP